MKKINLFGRWPIVHDLGHLVAAIAISFYLWQLAGWAFVPAFLVGATGVALFVELCDIAAGGFVVTHSQRLAALERRLARGNPWRPTRDNVKDFLNYQLAWPIGMLVDGNIEGATTIGIPLVILNAVFYLK